jgi:hypothetical protein
MVPTGSGLFLRDTVWISRDGRDYFYELELSPRGGGKIKEGLLLVEECSFHRCRFDGVGIAGTADERCKYPLPPAEPAQAAQAR